MHAPPDYRTFAILYVDDEEKSLKLFARAFRETFRVLTASSAKEGLRLFEAHKNEIAILMTDQRMPGEQGVWLLENARQLKPRVLRILATAYTDMEAAIAAVNSGAIYKYVTKPWDPVQLEHELKRGIEFFSVQSERDQLLKEKMSVLHNRMVADRLVSLGLLAAGLSHHIRNALVAVKTFLDLAPDKMREEKASLDAMRHPEFWNEYHHSVQGQIQRINLMLTELSCASEDPSVQFVDEVRLREVVNDSIGALRESLSDHNISVENNVSDSLPALKVDKVKFCRLFELLLRDEMASLPVGSTVSVSAAVASDSPSPNSEIEVLVRDNGPELPKEAMRLLFDPFLVRSGSPMEYGINLMACYFIVHHHGGSIRAQSQDGLGTTFTLRLPVDRALAPPLKEVPFLEQLLENEARWKKIAPE